MATKKKTVTETAPANGGLTVEMEEPVVTGEFPDIEAGPVVTGSEALAANDALPTVEQARAMFEARPDLASVVTDEGTLNRDGSFASARTLGLDGIWR